MKVEIRELEIELIPESEHDRDALEKLHNCGVSMVKEGRSSDHSWPPHPRRTNIILCLPDPSDWGT